MAVKIIIDSTCDVDKNVEDKFIKVPLHVTFGEEDFIDTVDITKDEFYEKLESSDELPKTSHPSPQAFIDEYQKVVNNGDEAVVICLTSGFSGTYEVALMASEEFKDKIFVVDSLQSCTGGGVIAEYALRLSEEGKSAKEIFDILEKEKFRVSTMAVVDTLKYLEKGGRLSKASALVGNLLSVKIILAMKDGIVVAIGKAKGTKNANNLFLHEIEKTGEIDFSMPIIFGYTGKDSEKIQKYFREVKKFCEKEVPNPPLVQIDSVIGTHTGPGSLYVAFFNK